jgi:hypothetical protein
VRADVRDVTGDPLLVRWSIRVAYLNYFIIAAIVEQLKLKNEIEEELFVYNFVFYITIIIESIER